MTHPIMRGIDVFGRRFFALRTESNCVVFFERYSDAGTWCGCPIYLASNLFGDILLMSSEGNVCKEAHSKLKDEYEKFMRKEASVIH